MAFSALRAKFDDILSQSGFSKVQFDLGFPSKVSLTYEVSTIQSIRDSHVIANWVNYGFADNPIMWHKLEGYTLQFADKHLRTIGKALKSGVDETFELVKLDKSSLDLKWTAGLVRGWETLVGDARRSFEHEADKEEKAKKAKAAVMAMRLEALPIVETLMTLLSDSDYVKQSAITKLEAARRLFSEKERELLDQRAPRVQGIK